MLIIGSRGSALALVQTNWVRDQICAQHPDLPVTVRIIRTSFDQNQQLSIRSAGSTGIWVKEIEDALLSGEIDLAVHSMKDVPTRIPEALDIKAIPIREDARDALIAKSGSGRLADLPEGAVIGTGSLRRQAQILAIRPDLRFREIRGNVDSRLRKLADGDYDAVILACAGLNRLGLEKHISGILGFHQMLPAPGQGALAIQGRQDDERVASLLAFLNHVPTAAAVQAERAFLQRLGGGCNSPIAVYARIEQGMMKVDGLIAAPDGTCLFRACTARPPGEFKAAAFELAENLLMQGGNKFIDVFCPD